MARMPAPRRQGRRRRRFSFVALRGCLFALRDCIDVRAINRVIDQSVICSRR